MTPIHELLNRIRWDKEFARGHFEIGYLDRHLKGIQRVFLADVSFPAQRQFFELADENGEIRRVPFHRVREVWRDDALIWKRPSNVALPSRLRRKTVT